MSANKKDVKPADPAAAEKKPFEARLVYSDKAALEVMDSDTFARRKDVLEAAGFEVHSGAIGDVTIAVLLPGKNKNVGRAAEIKTPTQAQLDAAAKAKVDAEVKAAEKAAADAKAKPVEKPAA